MAMPGRSRTRRSTASSRNSARTDGSFSRAEFHYDWERDLHISCLPERQGLKTSGTAHRGTRLKYIAKRIFKLDRLRLRWLNGARDEILLTATAQKLRKPARYVTGAG